MTYRATLNSAIGLYAVGGSAAGLLIVLGIASPIGRAGALSIGSLLVLLLVAIRVRYLVRITPDELRVRNLLHDVRMRWQDIVRVAPAATGGYWTGHLVGPSVVEFATRTTKLRINFKMFPRRCMTDVQEHLPPGVEQVVRSGGLP